MKTRLITIIVLILATGTLVASASEAEIQTVPTEVAVTCQANIQPVSLEPEVLKYCDYDSDCFCRFPSVPDCLNHVCRCLMAQ